MFNKDELNQLYHYALSLTSHEDIAYDLVQGGLERYLKKTATPSAVTIDKPLAYLKIVIRNLYFDIERHKKVVPMISTESDEIAHIEPIDSSVDSSMENWLMNQQEVQQLTALLSAEENELLYLWAVEEYSTGEIAHIYQQPRGTILSKLHRLKNRIRNHAEIVITAES